jgi:hypothetical protein
MLKLHTQEKPAKAVSDKPAAPEAPARQNNSAPGQ